MKKVLATLVGLALGLQASTNFIIVDEDIKMTDLDGKSTLYVGSPAKIISKDGETAIIELEGFVKDGSIYASKKFAVPFASSSNIAVKGDKGVIKAKVSTENIDEDEEYAWEASADMFYEKCTQCHAAPAINSHTMLEWDGLFSSMKQFAQPTPKEEATILRFLRSFAKDGYGKIAW